MRWDRDEAVRLTTEQRSARLSFFNTTVLYQYLFAVIWLVSDLHSFDAWMAFFFTGLSSGIRPEVASARLQRSQSLGIVVMRGLGTLHGSCARCLR